MNYKITKEAESDIITIHQWGVMRYGEIQADKYYWGLFNQLEKIAHSPLLYPAVNDIREGYRRSIYGSDHIYYRITSDSKVEITRIIGQQDISKII